MNAEVIVVGCGVAGVATALQLARRGHEVLVVDKATFPRDKVCGEGLMPHGVAALHHLGVAPEALGRPFTGIRYVAGGHTAVGRFPGGQVGIGLRRLRLDKQLHDLAVQTGRVAVRTRVVRDITGEPGAMVVHTREGPLRCRAVVGADGLHSKVRRKVGLHRELRSRKRYGLRRHYQLARPNPHDTVDVYVVEGAELYLTPTGEREVNVAVLAEEATMKSVGELGQGVHRLACLAPQVASLLEEAQPLSDAAACGPLRQSPRGVVADGVVLVGDAAGFVDAITGEGMSLTLLSATLAAEVLSQGLRTGRLHQRDLRPYAKARASTLRQLTLLTEIILWGIRKRPLARRVVRNLARHPDVFGQVLAVNTGQAALTSLGLRGLTRALVG